MNCITKIGLALLPAFFLFSSCKKNKDKITLTPDDPIEVLFTDTLTVNSSVVLMNDTIRTDTINTSTFRKEVFTGSYLDSAFGNVYASAYAQLQKIDTTNLTNFPLDSIVSVTLNIQANYEAGDIANGTTINVFTLSDSIRRASKYYSTSEIKPLTQIGKLTTSPYSISKKSTNYLTIDLDKNYGKSILENSGSKSNEEFKKALYGLALIPDSTQNGCILKVILDYSFLNITYLKASDTTINSVKSTVVHDKIYSVLMSGAGTKSFFRFIGKRENTVLANLKNPYDSISTKLTNNLGFVQAGIGIKTRINIPYFNKFKALAGSIVVNRAELILSTPYIAPGLVATPNLRIVAQNASGNFYTNGLLNPFVQSNIDANGYLTDVEFNFPNFGYVFVLTNYVQGIINGASPNVSLLIAPSDNINTFGLSRVIFSNPRLKIYYTKVN